MNERCVGCTNNWCEVRQVHLNKIHFDRCQAGKSVEHIDNLYETIKQKRESRKTGKIKIVIASSNEPTTSKPPRWLKYVRFFRSPEDRGAGDTVQRIAAKFGGERFKKFAKKMGIPCGCTSRQDRWNKQYPYS
jgi:hypothetical protein